MIKFELRESYNPRTGLPSTPSWVASYESVCDYTGLSIEDPVMVHSYNVNEISGSEEIWYSDQLPHGVKFVDIRKLNEKQGCFIFHPQIFSKKNDDILYVKEKHPLYGCSVDLFYRAEALLAAEWLHAMNFPLDTKPPRSIAEAMEELGLQYLEPETEHRQGYEAACRSVGRLPREPYMARCETLGMAMHKAGYRTITKLLSEGTKPEELGIEFEEDDDKLRLDEQP